MRAQVAWQMVHKLLQKPIRVQIEDQMASYGHIHCLPLRLTTLES